MIQSNERFEYCYLLEFYSLVYNSLQYQRHLLPILDQKTQKYFIKVLENGVGVSGFYDERTCPQDYRK